MTGMMGYYALALALIAAVYGAFVSVLGARRGHWALVRSGERSALAVFGLATLAVGAMEYALLTHDFSVGYVAEVGSRSTPLHITIISLWAALEGSILFWLWVLTLYTALCVWLYRNRHHDETPYVTATLLVISAFFLMLLLGPGNPFQRVSPVPMDGPGPNPLLQNHPLMALHPPAQYLGYVGFSVPYAFAVAALVTGRVDAWWVRAVRRWTLTAWIFLSISIIAGGWWAYEVLGWGGYWAWDPVENAALMPWLVGTAFLHSVMVQERREMLRGWNVALVVTTFALTIFGTFLTRSGILGSVHAFSESPIGPLLLGFLAVVLVFSTVLVLWRGSLLAAPGRLDKLVSREAALLVADLLFLGLTFTIFLGTIFPLVVEAATGGKISVGAPYFNKMTVPLFALVVFLMGVGPALPWRRSGRAGLKDQFLVPAGVGGAVALVAVALGERGLWPLVTFGLAGFSAWVMLSEVAKGVRARVRRGESPPSALLRLVTGNRRRYGGYIVHLGVLMAAVAVTASWNHRVERQATLGIGDHLQIGSLAIRLDRLRGVEQPNRYSVVADVDVWKDGRLVERRTPKLNYYTTREEPIPTPSVRSTASRDVFLNLVAFEKDGSGATLKVVVMPLVIWLWIAGAVLALGTLVAVWPEGRRARAYAEAVAREPLAPTHADEEEVVAV